MAQILLAPATEWNAIQEAYALYGKGPYDEYTDLRRQLMALKPEVHLENYPVTDANGNKYVPWIREAIRRSDAQTELLHPWKLLPEDIERLRETEKREILGWEQFYELVGQFRENGVFWDVVKKDRQTTSAEEVTLLLRAVVE